MNRNEYVNEVLIPAMFVRADVLFGDKLQFTSYAYGWRTHKHLNGVDTDTHAKTTWRANTPFYIKDWGTGVSGAPVCAKQGPGGGFNAEVVALYAEYYCGGDRNAAIDRLLVECKLVDDYKEKVRPYTKSTDGELTQRHTDMAACDALFRQTFGDKSNATTQRVIDYLKTRGWTVDDMEQSGVGVIDAATKAHVPEGYAAHLNDLVGTSHVIAIPLRINGRVDRFHFRNCGERGAKYQKEKTNRFSDKTQLFGTWNFVGTNIVVEGVLDYLHARAFGINVLLSEGAPTDKQIVNAARHTAKSFTLMFDADTAGWGYTQRMGKALIAANKDVKVATLPPLDVPQDAPDGSTATQRTWFNDPDEWLSAVNKITPHTGEEREAYVERFLEAVRNAVPYDVWRAEVLERWFVVQVLNVEEQHPDVNNITTEVVDRVCKAAKNEHGDLFVERVAKILADTTGTVNASRVASVFRKWDDGFKREAARAQEAQAKGEEPVKTPFIFDLSALQGADVQTPHEEQPDALIDEIKGKNGGSEWAEKYGVLVPSANTFEDILEDATQIEDGVPSMFAFPGDVDGEHIATYMQYVKFFPGLTLLCANTGHGKTSILNAVALYDAERNKVLKNNKVTLYLSFEIERAVLLADMVNLYNDDPELSKNPVATLRNYFSKKLYNTEKYKSKRFAKGHYTPFEDNMKTFFKEYLTRGGHLHIVKRNYYAEELVEGLTWYYEQTKNPDGIFAGKELSMVCIDYAQLLRSSSATRQRTEEIKQIVQGLNNLAKDVLHVPIVMCAQFNQQVSSPAKIAINCIGEGGDFSRYADTVIGFYNLEKLTPAGDTSDKMVVSDFKELGIKIGTGDAFPPKGTFKNVMFARLLKTRNGSFPKDTLMLWNGKIKKLYTNCNRYVADTERARAEGLKFTEVLKKGREELLVIGKALKNAIGDYACQQKNTKIEVFMGALSTAVKDEEDDDPLLQDEINAEFDYKKPTPVEPEEPENDGMFYTDGTPVPADDYCPF